MYAKCCSKSFTNINSFNPPYNTMSTTIAIVKMKKIKLKMRFKSALGPS